MTQEQISLVQSSFATIAPRALQVAERFYARLFTLDPTLQRLFHGDLPRQGAKLMQALSLVVGSLHQFDTLLPALQALGQRHVGYGVHASDYDTVGAALLWTLEHELGADWTPDTQAAWAQAYDTLAMVMQEAVGMTTVGS